MKMQHPSKLTITILVVGMLAIWFVMMQTTFGAATRAIPKFYLLRGHPVVCVDREGRDPASAEWNSRCALIGPWFECVETEETIECFSGRRV